MKSKLFIVALATAAGTAFAQNAIVNNLPGTFVNIAGLPGAQAVFNGAVANDDVNVAVTTSVTNSMFASTTARICTNGFVQFGGTAGATTYLNTTIAAGTVSPVAPATSQALFPFWDDMLLPANSGRNVYKIEGPAASFGLPAARGNVLIIQWDNVAHYNAGAAVGAATYQVQIFQNIVNNVAAQMLYSDVMFENALFDEGVSATIGYAAGTNGGPASVNNVLYSFNTAGSVHAGDVLSLLIPATSLPPTVSGSANPAGSQAGDTVLYTANASPGLNPTSTALAVRGDLSAVGGPTNAAFHDDGLAGDVTAGDGVFSYRYTIPPATPVGAYSVGLTVSDAQGRSGTGTISGNIFVPPASTDLGQIGAGAGGSQVVTTVDVGIVPAGITWLKFSIGTNVLNASTNYLDIDTEPTVPDGPALIGSINDTELGLYTSAGVFHSTDDDDGSDYHSQLTYGDSTNVRPAIGNAAAAGGNGRDGSLNAGSYYMAVGCFNSVFATNFNATSTSNATGTVQVNFRTNIPGGGGPACGLADVGRVGGAPGADAHLDNNDFVVFIDYFFSQNALADQGSTGGTPGADGVWDNNDFIVFIDNFFNAPASCR